MLSPQLSNYGNQHTRAHTFSLPFSGFMDRLLFLNDRTVCSDDHVLKINTEALSMCILSVL